ncbi:MAG: RpiB/LacA/LacB family sugar-phosphate isomerase [Oscillospiraceae bacterium]|nr:RpiB/LacA/LacB family sugar-phosphate isomerase [Oscillospiraceae bacterium]
MNIALVMEWSTSAKNETVNEVLTKAAQAKGHSVVNYGQYNMEDNRQTYNQNAIFTAVLLASGAADFVITGCGTGEGAMLACNSMPGVVCGLVADPADSYLFTQINGGNCLSLPYNKGWGWAAEVNLEYMFEKLFVQAPGGGYPPSAAASEQRNAALLNKLKGVSHRSLEEILNAEDPDIHEMVVNAFAGKRMELFRANCKDAAILKLVEGAIAK